MNALISPLIVFPASAQPVGVPEVGQLATVILHNGERAGARILRLHGDPVDNVSVQLVGLAVPQPYEIGMRLTIDREKLVDWGE